MFGHVAYNLASGHLIVPLFMVSQFSDSLLALKIQMMNIVITVTLHIQFSSFIKLFLCPYILG